MKRLLLALCFVVLSVPVEAAVTFDAVATGTGTNTTTHDHDIAADANLIVIGISYLDGDGTPEAVEGVTVGGQAASLVTGCVRSQGTVRTELWALVNPPTGDTVSVVVDLNGGGTDNMIAGSISFKGAATSSTFGTCDVDGTADSTVNTIIDLPSTTNDMAVLVTTAAGVRTFSDSGTAPTSDERYDTTTGTNVSGAGYTEVGGASEVDLLVNLSSSATHADVGVVINAAVVTRRPSAPIMFQ